MEAQTTTEPWTTSAHESQTSELTTELTTTTEPQTTTIEQLATTDSTLITATNQTDTIPLTSTTSNTSPPLAEEDEVHQLVHIHKHQSLQPLRKQYPPCQRTHFKPPLLPL